MDSAAPRWDTRINLSISQHLSAESHWVCSILIQGYMFLGAKALWNELFAPAPSGHVNNESVVRSCPGCRVCHRHWNNWGLGWEVLEEFAFPTPCPLLLLPRVLSHGTPSTAPVALQGNKFYFSSTLTSSLRALAEISLFSTHFSLCIFTMLFLTYIQCVNSEPLLRKEKVHIYI